MYKRQVYGRDADGNTTAYVDAVFHLYAASDTGRISVSYTHLFGTDTEADIFNINLDHHPYCRDLMCCLHHSGVYVNALCVESYGKNVFVCPGGPAYYEDGELISSAPFLHDGLTLIDTQDVYKRQGLKC